MVNSFSAWAETSVHCWDVHLSNLSKTLVIHTHFSAWSWISVLEGKIKVWLLLFIDFCLKKCELYRKNIADEKVHVRQCSHIIFCTCVVPLDKHYFACVLLSGVNLYLWFDFFPFFPTQCTTILYIRMISNFPLKSDFFKEEQFHEIFNQVIKVNLLAFFTCRKKMDTWDCISEI